MDDMTAFEHQVARDALHDVGPVRPVDDAAIFTAITATQSPKWRFQSMFSATKVVVAGAVVALFGGFLLAGVLTTQPSDDQLPAVGASASASPEPAPVVTGVYDVGGRLDSLVESRGAIWVAGSDGPVQRIDSVTREVTEVTPRGSGVWYLVTTDDAVWASGDDGLLRIEPSTGAVTHTYPSLFSWRPPLEAEGSLWVSGEGTLYEVDLESREIVGEYDSPHVGGWLGSGDGELWLWGDDVLARFDLDGREFEGVFPLPSSPWNGSTYEESHLVSDDAVWLMAEPSGQVLRFDISSQEVTDAFDLKSDSGYPGASIDTGDAVWIPSGEVVYRIDRQSRQITDEIEVAGSLVVNRVPVVADGALWVATRDPGAVHRIDLESREVSHAVKISGEPFALAASDGYIWVAGGRGIVTRISTGATDAEEAPEPSPISDPPDLEDTTTPDLLPGVDLDTAEVRGQARPAQPKTTGPGRGRRRRLWRSRWHRPRDWHRRHGPPRRTRPPRPRRPGAARHALRGWLRLERACRRPRDQPLRHPQPTRATTRPTQTGALVMNEMTAFDQQIADEVLREAGPSEPVDGAAILTAITTTQSPKWRFQSMFSATKLSSPVPSWRCSAASCSAVS